MSVQDPGVCVWTVCPGIKIHGEILKTRFIAFLLEVWFLISFPPAHWPDFACLSLTSSSCPIKAIFGGGCAHVPEHWPLQNFLNIPSCKHTFNWLLFESVFLFICSYGTTYNLPDLMISGVLGWLVCFWLWGLCGVQPEVRSYFFLPQSLQADSCLRLVLKHVRSDHKLCFWLCQSSYQGGANSTACCFFTENSPSVCHHSSPVGIRQVTPKCLSPENHGEYQAPVSIERVMAQSAVREDHISLGAHAEPADRAVTCPWGQTTPISLSAGPLCMVAADRQPGNHCLTGKAEGEAKTTTKTKVWLTENTLQAGAGSCCKERKQRW